MCLYDLSLCICFTLLNDVVDVDFVSTCFCFELILRSRPAARDLQLGLQGASEIFGMGRVDDSWSQPLKKLENLSTVCYVVPNG